MQTWDAYSAGLQPSNSNKPNAYGIRLGMWDQAMRTVNQRMNG